MGARIIWLVQSGRVKRNGPVKVCLAEVGHNKAQNLRILGPVGVGMEAQVETHWAEIVE